MTKTELLAALVALPDHGQVYIQRGALRDAAEGSLFDVASAAISDDGPDDFGMLQIGDRAGSMKTTTMSDDLLFIDDVCALAKQMIRDLREGVAVDGETRLQSASEFLAQRLDDPPVNEDQLRVVLATFVAVHRYRMTTPESGDDPDLPYLLTPWDKEYGGGMST